MNIELDKWNPRVGENYEIKDHNSGLIFSSIQHDFYVVEATGFSSWTEKASELAKCLSKTSKVAGLLVSAWSPGANELLQAIRGEFDVVNESNRTIWAEINIKNGVERALSLREKFGSGSSGEWVIIGGDNIREILLSSKFPPKQNNFLDILCSHEIGFFLEIGEMQQSLLITRYYQGIETDIAAIF